MYGETFYGRHTAQHQLQWRQIKFKSNRSNPTYNTVLRPNYFTIFQNKLYGIPTFGIRIAPALNTAGIKVRNIQSNSILNIPPWTIKQPEVLFTLTTDKKEITDSSIFRAKFQELSSQYPDFQNIYTDGSKDGPTLHQLVYLGLARVQNTGFLLVSI